MNLATWSIRNPIPASLLFILLTLAGLWGFRQLHVQDFPDLDFPTVNVALKLPGAAPSQLETEVAKKVEDKLATLARLAHMSTTISDGNVSIALQFEIGTVLSDALLDVKDAVDSVRGELPADLEAPQVSKVTLGPGGPTMTFAVTSSAMDEEALSWLTDSDIARRMLTVPGVGQFTRVGGVQREVQVLVNPAAMNALGVTATDVSRALKRVQQDNSGGRVQLGGGEQGLRTVATVQRVDELKALPIALADGRAVRLDQVAEVRDGLSERAQAALLDGRPALGFQLSRSRGADETRVEAGVTKALAELEFSHPGLKFQLVSSTVEHTREQYRGSMHMLYEGALLTVLVIWLYLRDWRATLVGAMALPLSILPTFAFMAWAGYALNTITLLALAVVVGILVDDAIVEIENIARHGRMGKSARQAVEDGVNEIWLAVLATTAALVVVFLPTAFMSGVPGLVFKQFGWTVVVAVLTSLLVARVATPMMAAAWLRDQPAHDEQPGRWMQAYLRAAAWCLKHRGTTLALSTLFFAGSLALVPLLPVSFMPPSDKGSSTIHIELPPGSSLQHTLIAAEEARLAISGIAGIQSVFVTAGTPQRAGGPVASAGEVRKASLTVNLKDRGERPAQTEIENGMRPLLQAVPGIRWSISGGGPGEKLALVLASTDGQALKQAADEVEAQMRGLGYLSGISSTASLERPELTVRPHAAQAAERGVSTQAIGETLRVATSGDFGSALAKLNLDERQLEIRVRLPDELRQDLQTLTDLRVPGRAGEGVPLSSVAAVALESGPSQINRFDRLRNVSITADLGGYALGSALADVKALSAVRALPPGVVLVESGDAEILGQLFGGFALALAIGVVCKYAVQVLLYKDWLQPLTVLSTLPLCVGGAMLALLMTGAALSLPALIGLVMLFGVVTKNSILIVDYALIAERELGLSHAEALLDACAKRARPVMMTTMAMVAGLLPMSMGWGGDGSFRQPMAIAVIGGLITSTALSLVVVPVVSQVVHGAQQALRRWVGGGHRPSPAAQLGDAG
jgi:multidrug efflux pump subunit AcrB